MIRPKNPHQLKTRRRGNSQRVRRPKASKFFDDQYARIREIRRLVNRGRKRKPFSAVNTTSVVKRIKKSARVFMKVANKKMSFAEHVHGSDYDQHEQTREVFQERQRLFPQDNEAPISPLTDDHLKEITKPCKDTMAEITGYMLFDVRLKTRADLIKAGYKHLSEESSKHTSRNQKAKIDDEIEQLIKNAGLPILEPSKEEQEFKTNACSSVFVGKNDLANVSTLDKNVFYKYTRTNEILRNTFDQEYKKASEQLEKDADKFNCKCVNCDDRCPCHKKNQLFIKNIAYGACYSCSEKCACNAKCTKSVVEPPEDNFQVFVHPNTGKGCGVRSRRAHGKGESVMEFTGQIKSESVIDLQDAYSIGHYNKELKKYFLTIFIDHAQTLKDLKVGRWTQRYEENLEIVLEQNHQLDPRTKGNEGRFMSHSCFPNCAPLTVYSKGLDPSNARMIFTSIMVIYPFQEFTFFYSIEYLCNQLKDSCSCGELCCYRNRHLFPYITDDHIKRFYAARFRELHRRFLANTAPPGTNATNPNTTAPQAPRAGMQTRSQT